TGYISARSVETGDDSSCNRIGIGRENDWNRLRRRHHGAHAWEIAANQDDCDLAPDEIVRHCRHPIVLTLGPAILDRDVAALDEAYFGKTPVEPSHGVCPFSRRHAVKYSDDRHSRLLCARRQRPRRRAAEQRG